MKYNHSHLPLPADSQTYFCVSMYELDMVYMGVLRIHGKRYFAYMCNDAFADHQFGYAHYIIAPVTFKQFRELRMQRLSINEVLDTPEAMLIRTRYAIPGSSDYPQEVRFLSRLENGLKDVQPINKPADGLTLMCIKFPYSFYD